MAYRRRVVRRAESTWSAVFSQAIRRVSWDSIRANPGAAIATTAVAVWVVAAVSVTLLTFAGSHAAHAQTTPPAAPAPHMPRPPDKRRDLLEPVLRPPRPRRPPAHPPRRGRPRPSLSPRPTGRPRSSRRCRRRTRPASKSPSPRPSRRPRRQARPSRRNRPRPSPSRFDVAFAAPRRRRLDDGLTWPRAEDHRACLSDFMALFEAIEREQAAWRPLAAAARQLVLRSGRVSR